MTTAALSVASYANQLPRVIPFGDSITYGVGSSAVAGYREILWTTAQSNGLKFAFGGSQVFAGDDNTFTQYPYNEGYPGITAADLANKFAGQATIFSECVTLAAGTNDIADGGSGGTAAGVVATLSSDLDQLWAYRTTATFQIGLYTILRRLDGFDSTVQAANALIPAMVAGKSYAANITIIDIYAACSVPGDYSDGILHPNDIGCAKIAAMAYPAFSAMVTRTLR